MFGLSKMLLDYGVENPAIKITDKGNEIAEIETPFIAHFGGDFVVVDKVDVKNGMALFCWFFLFNSRLVYPNICFVRFFDNMPEHLPW